LGGLHLVAIQPSAHDKEGLKLRVRVVDRLNTNDRRKWKATFCKYLPDATVKRHARVYGKETGRFHQLGDGDLVLLHITNPDSKEFVEYAIEKNASVIGTSGGGVEGWFNSYREIGRQVGWVNDRVELADWLTNREANPDIPLPWVVEGPGQLWKDLYEPLTIADIQIQGYLVIRSRGFLPESHRNRFEALGRHGFSGYERAATSRKNLFRPPGCRSKDGRFWFDLVVGFAGTVVQELEDLENYGCLPAVADPGAEGTAESPISGYSALRRFWELIQNGGTDLPKQVELTTLFERAHQEFSVLAVRLFEGR